MGTRIIRRVTTSQKDFNTGPRQMTSAIFIFETYLMKERVSVMVESPMNPYI